LQKSPFRYEAEAFSDNKLSAVSDQPRAKHTICCTLMADR